MADTRRKLYRDYPETSSIGDEKEQILFPQKTLPLFHQLAGHRHGKGKSKLGLLLHEDGSVLKPVVEDDVRGKREQSFYEMAYNHVKSCKTNCEHPLSHELCQLIPKYLGIYKPAGPSPSPHGKTVTYIKLEDLARSFKYPCIADIKIGQITYGLDATPEKIKIEESKYPIKKITGYRISSMRIYEHGIPRLYGAEYCDNLTEDTIVDGLKKFISTKPSNLPEIINALERILSWFEVQRDIAFYSSSILIVYEANETRAVGKMIDFAHVFPTKNSDENYMIGLKNLIRDFRKCLPPNEH